MLLVGRVVAGFMQMAGVAATPGPRFMYKDLGEYQGATHGARMARDDVPQPDQTIKLTLPTRKQLRGMTKTLGLRRPLQIPRTILIHMPDPREKARAYTHVEADWGVSCANALECAHRRALSHYRYMYTTSDTGLGTILDIVHDHDHDHEGKGQDTGATVTIDHTLAASIVIIRLPIATAASIGPQQ